MQVMLPAAGGVREPFSSSLNFDFELSFFRSLRSVGCWLRSHELGSGLVESSFEAAIGPLVARPPRAASVRVLPDFAAVHGGTVEAGKNANVSVATCS